MKAVLAYAGLQLVILCLLPAMDWNHLALCFMFMSPIHHELLFVLRTRYSLKLCFPCGYPLI